MGHPAPFGLRYLGIGNEQWDQQYLERYKEFHARLKAAHPEISLVAAAGPSPQGALFDYAWKELRAVGADIVDEHYYNSPEWFLQQASRYDRYDRKGPKVFAGEYAAQSRGMARADNENNWWCALAEAAFMTGLERNADVVRMASYAPLFAHADAFQWAPDLIWFDNLRAYGTPNYYVQQLFSTNRGDRLLQVLDRDKALQGQDSLYGSAVLDSRSGELIVKLVNVSSRPIDIETTVSGARTNGKPARILVLAADKGAVNSLGAPRSVTPAAGILPLKGGRLLHSVAPHSLTIIRIPATIKK
jgi:alpha-L-arabinofuranosidase